MTIIYQPKQLSRPDGSPSGRWHVVGESDEERLAFAVCPCPDAHESPEAARACPEAAARLAREFPKLPHREDLGRRAYEAYSESLLPGESHVAWSSLIPADREAWCCAVDAARR